MTKKATTAIDPASLEAATAVQFVYLDPSTLLPSSNPRRVPVSEERIQELAASMRQVGVLQPLLVRPFPVTSEFQVVAGDTRRQAALLAGLTLVPCTVREMDDVEMLAVQLIENVQRNDMHPLDEGEAFRQLLDSKKHTVESLALTLGKSVRWVYTRLEFTKLIPALREAFLAGQFTASHAELLARLTPEQQAAADNREDPWLGGLWRHELPVLQTDDETAESALKARGVDELREWIEQHVRLRVETENVQALLPEVEDVQLEAARENSRVLQLANASHLPKAEGDEWKGVLTERHWKRAGGRSACASAEKGVIVFGSGQGEVLDVCVNKKGCAQHWPEYQEAAKGAKADERERVERERQEAESARAREDQAREQVISRAKVLAPGFKKAALSLVAKQKSATAAQVEALADYYSVKATTTEQLVLALVGKRITEAFAWCYSIDDAKKQRAWAIAAGVDVKAIEAECFPGEVKAPKPAKAAKPAKKAAPKKKPAKAAKPKKGGKKR